MTTEHHADIPALIAEAREAWGLGPAARLCSILADQLEEQRRSAPPRDALVLVPSNDVWASVKTGQHLADMEEAS